MPEVDALLKVRAAEEAKLKSPLTKRTFETEMVSDRSIRSYCSVAIQTDTHIQQYSQFILHVRYTVV